MRKQVEQNARWFPSHEQLKDPQSTERSFRNLLDMFYQLQDSHAELQSHVKQSNKEAVPASTNTTNTASTQRFLGLPVKPSDTTDLADGTVLTYVKANRWFEFL